ncbi:MAG: TetR/AcrR family transcriptional regulator [Anaerolineae bacterium]
MPADHDPIREQLIEARRNQILEAAASVFAEKGYHRATTREIASTAGVSEGTIYNYFDNKADLLIGMISRLAELRDLPQELQDALQSDAQEFIVAIFRDRMGRIVQSHEDVFQAVLPEILINPELRERYYQEFMRPTAEMLEAYIQARIQMGRIRPIDVPLAVRVVQGMFVGLLMFRFLGDVPVRARWDELPEVIGTIIFDGLSPRSGG